MRKWRTIEQALHDVMTLPVGGRAIKLVVLHHTWQPDHARWRGDATAEAVRRFWLLRQRQNGWTYPPGGHFLVAPDGAIYAPFDDLRLPLNANSDSAANRTGVAVEAVGNFDLGHDELEGTQRHVVVGLLAAFLVRFRLGPECLMFHRQFQRAGKTCPGSGISLEEMRAPMPTAMAWVRKQLGKGD